jgi:translation initiation factor 3 subunit L
MLRRYPDAIRTFVTVLNFIMRMRQYHTRSYQYDQVFPFTPLHCPTTHYLLRLAKLLTGCMPFSLCATHCHRADWMITLRTSPKNVMASNSQRWRGEGKRFTICLRFALLICLFFISEESLAAFEELFLYACPKFIAANPPPYDDPAALANLISPPSPDSPTEPTPAVAPTDPTHRHLSLFLADAEAQAPVPTLRSFLKLYTSLGAKKLANFLDADEEEMVQEMMVMKQVSRSVSRVAGSEKGGLLDGQTITTSDLNFVIDEVNDLFNLYFVILLTVLQNMVHIAESTIGRRYAGWFIKNTERTQRIFDDLKNMPLPPPPKALASVPAPSAPTQPASEAPTKGPRTGGQKVAWGGVKVA